MNTELERAAFQRWFDGLAAKGGVSSEVIARLAWQRRAELDAEHNALLLDAVRQAVMFAAFAVGAGYPVGNIYDVLDCAIEKVTN